MSDLNLPEEIIVSCLRGEDPAEAVTVLDYVLMVVRNRQHDLIARGLRKWDGHDTVVVIVPSSEVFSGDCRTVDQAQLLARIGRASGVALRLIDVTPPLRPADENGPAVYSLSACGSAVLREYVNSPDLESVTFHQLSPREMVELAENV